MRAMHGRRRNRGPFTRTASSCAIGVVSFLLLSADADFAPWPVATYDNGTVVVSGHTAGIHLAPVAGHTAKVLGDLEVQGALEVQGVDVLDVLQALSPPVCDGANEKLQFSNDAWLCVCESAWSGTNCDVSSAGASPTPASSGAEKAVGGPSRLPSLPTDYVPGAQVVYDGADFLIPGVIWGSQPPSLPTNPADVLQRYNVDTGPSNTISVPSDLATGKFGGAVIGSKAYYVAPSKSYGPTNPVECGSSYFYELDLDSLTWTSLPALPATRFSVGVATIGNVLYVVGGDGCPPWSTSETCDYPAKSNNDTFSFDTTAGAGGSWVTRSPVPLKVVSFVGEVSGKLYAIGRNLTEPQGQYNTVNPGEFTDMFKYDPSSDTWVFVTRVPSTGAVHERTGAVVGGKIAIVYNGDLPYSEAAWPWGVHAVDVYDPATGTWAKSVNINFVRGYTRVASDDDGSLYVFGGQETTVNFFSSRPSSRFEYFRALEPWPLRTSKVTRFDID